MDLTDSLHLTSECVGAGLNANVSALSFGASDVSGFWGGNPVRNKLGLGGIQSATLIPKTIKGIGLPIQESPPRSRWNYGGTTAPFASIGISGGFFVNFGASIDFLEMIDFIGGIFFIDIMDDDLKIETTRNALVSDHQDWFKSYFKSIEVLSDKVKLTPDYSKTSINRMTDPIISININEASKLNNTIFTLEKCDTQSVIFHYQSSIEIQKNHTQIDSGTITVYLK